MKMVLFIKYTFQDFSTPQQKSEKTGQFPTRGNLLEYLQHKQPKLAQLSMTVCSGKAVLKAKNNYVVLVSQERDSTNFFYVVISDLSFIEIKIRF